MTIEIKRVEDHSPDAEPTYWSVYADGQRVTDETTFRKAWNQANRLGGTKETIVLDPLDQ